MLINFVNESCSNGEIRTSQREQLTNVEDTFHSSLTLPIFAQTHFVTEAQGISEIPCSLSVLSTVRAIVTV